ncbi:MAG TPA: hypothetical protein VID26_06230 [Candidatus Limnocylindrales bacterium]|jgi:hypothetical protein
MFAWIRRYPGRGVALLAIIAIGALGLVRAYLESPPTFVALALITGIAAVGVALERPKWRRNYHEFAERMKAREPGTVYLEAAILSDGLLREARADQAADRPTTIDADRMPGVSSGGEMLIALVAAPSGIQLWRLRSLLRGEPVRFATFYWKDIASIGLGKTPWGLTDTLPLVTARRTGSPLTLWSLSTPLGQGWWKFKTSPDAATIARLEDLRSTSDS